MVFDATSRDLIERGIASRLDSNDPQFVWAKQPGHIIGKRPGQRLIVTSKQEETHLWVKRVNHPSPELESRLIELHEQSRTEATHSVPEIWFYDNTRGLLVTPWSPGRPLIRRFVARALIQSRGKLEEWIEQSARRLAAFHQLSATQERRQHLIAWSGPLFKLTKLLNISVEQRDSLHTALSSIPPTLMVDMVRPHNDFTLRNLLLEPDGSLTLVDFDSVAHPAFPEWTPRYRDVAVFALNLCTLIRRTPLASADLGAQLEDRFFKAYAQAAAIAPETLSWALFVANLGLQCGRYERSIQKIYGAEVAALTLNAIFSQAEELS